MCPSNSAMNGGFAVACQSTHEIFAMSGIQRFSSAFALSLGTTSYHLMNPRETKNSPALRLVRSQASLSLIAEIIGTGSTLGLSILIAVRKPYHLHSGCVH